MRPGYLLMMTTLAATLLAAANCLAAAPKVAPPKPLAAEERLEESPRHHEWVEITTASGRKLRAFVVFPEVDRPTPAVIVIHENQGLNAWARSLTDQVAESGYVAIAPDMLSGKGADGGGTDSFDSSDAARTAIYALSDTEVREALDATVKHARDLQGTTDAVVVSGFCWGGGKAFDYAAHNPEIKAAFVFYGSAPDAERLKEIRSPVYGFYGSNDFRITGQVPEVNKKLEELDKSYEPEIYEGAGHGFMRAGEGEGAKPADSVARDQAWKRWQRLLNDISRD